MKGFGIYVKNNLLEPKHIEAMGESVWLYMWLLDKMTSVNENGLGKVLGGKPVTYEQVQSELGLTIRTYRRWVDRLRDAGYILTLRTPYGLSITVLKAEKIFTSKRSAKNGTSKKLREVSDVPKMAQPDVPNLSADVPKMAQGGAKNGTSNKDNTVDNTIDSNTNVLEPSVPEKFGKTEINEIFDFWGQEVGYDITSKVQANRRAAYNLIRKYGPEKLTQLIKGVALTQSDPYAPRIADFCDLQSKTTQLIAWGQRKHGVSAIGVVR